MSEYVITWVNDASNVNDRRMYVDGSQWAKVYGWDQASLNARCDALEAALSAPAPQGIGREWQPIETAPRDGTTVLTYGSLHDDGAPYGIGETPTVKVSQYVQEHGYWCCDAWGSHQPVWWQPLPEPPAQGEATLIERLRRGATDGVQDGQERVVDDLFLEAACIIERLERDLHEAVSLLAEWNETIDTPPDPGSIADRSIKFVARRGEE